MSRLLMIVLAFTATVATAQTAKVIKIKGTVLVDGVLLASDSIANGVTIDTSAKDSQLDISINGEAFSRLRGGKTVLHLPVKGGDETLLELVGGEVYAFLKDGAMHKMKVRTQTSVMGVRGTKFYVSDSAEKSYLCVCEGVVHARPTGKTNAPGADVAAGSDWHVTSKGDVKGPVVATKQMMDMTKDVFKDMGYPVK